MFTTGSDRDLMDKLFEQADEYKQSWHGWEYSRPDPLPEIPSLPKTKLHSKGSTTISEEAIVINEEDQETEKEKPPKSGSAKSTKSGSEKLPKSGSIQIQETSRTYPQAVAGFTDSYKFDKDSKVFTLAYRTNAACKSGVTEIYFNKVMHYPDGFDHQLSPSEGITMSISNDGYRIILQHNEGIAANTTISFSMQPKAQTTTTKSPQKYQHQFTRPKTYQRYPFVPGHVRYPNYPQTNQGFSYYHHQTIDQHFPHYPQTNQHRYPVHPLLNYYLSYSKTNHHSINQH